jgi:hypothetical protein
VQDNDFRHAVLTNAQFPAELPETNKIERPAGPPKLAVGPEISPKQPGRSPQQAPAEIEQRPDREKLAETLRREIESRSQKLREGDSGFSREADALHLAKEMLRQVEAGADRIDLTTTYRAADQDAAEERHVRAYNSVNPLIAEAYAKGITVDRGSVQVERAQAITEEAARLQKDLNATQKGQDRNELVAETKNLAAESVSLRTTGEAQEQELRSDLDREGMIPFLTMGQERFDALLSVGVFDAGKTLEWRKEMDGKISERFRVLSEDAASHGKDPRALWQEAAKQVQQSSVLTQPGREGESLDRGREREDLGQALTQKQELRRTVALAR